MKVIRLRSPDHSLPQPAFPILRIAQFLYQILVRIDLTSVLDEDTYDIETSSVRWDRIEADVMRLVFI